MSEKRILYFDEGGEQCTGPTLEAARERVIKPDETIADGVKPEAVVVTSTTGKTALEAARIFEGTGVRLIAVPFQKHLWDKFAPPDPDLVRQCRGMGVEFLPDEPVVPLLDTERPDVVAAWWTVSQGFKVALQVASMCVDTGLLREGAEVIAVGGSGTGADTALLLETRGYEHVLSSNVKEVIAMPRR